jgi:LmbE family N-acetylglucosaminyl deacetylase
MKLDVLAIGVHPDDVELSCSGVLLVEKKNGKKTGIIDLTQGELGTRGTAETRKEEAAKAGNNSWGGYKRKSHDGGWFFSK